MKNPNSTIYIFCIVVLIGSFGEKHINGLPNFSGPKPIGDDEKELLKRREKYFELSHRSAPGVDWKKVEIENRKTNIKLRALMKQNTISDTEYFANGKIKGVWSERGSTNQAGSIIAADFDSTSNDLYVVSSGGSIWKNKGLVTNNWKLINDDYIFNNGFLKVIKTKSLTRLLVIADNQLKYSDDDGFSFINASVQFPVAWAGNVVLQAVFMNGVSNDVYLLCNNWDETSHTPLIALYRSIDLGTSFSRIYSLKHSESDLVKILKPYNSNLLLLFDCKSSKGYIQVSKISGNTVSLLSKTLQPQLPLVPQFASVSIAGSLSIYMMINNSAIYKSTDYGVNWQFKGALPENSWGRLDVSNNNDAIVFAGGVNAMRSADHGVTWSFVNQWWEYYNNITGKLHADIMNIASFKNSTGKSFTLINTHGGVAISYDNLQTTSNLSLSALNSAQFYDILTALDFPDIIYGGSQDQGLQKTKVANTTEGPLDFAQLLTGDFGYLVLADIFRTLYAQYPGGNLYVYNHSTDAFIKTWGMPGTQKPNYGWMMPSKNVANPVSDTFLMAGGNLSGGGGSYLCRIAMPQSAGYAVHSTQYNYDFRDNSNNSQSGITSIEVSSLQPERMYVATEDGTFFYTGNAGSSWQKSTTFSVGGGWYLYGSSILASKLTKNLLWYGGSGYGSVPVFKSIDGGITFHPMNIGLPQTLVHEMVANLDESLIFAATDAGPYVYVVQDKRWYPMIGEITPLQTYTSVEYLSLTNTVRFGTYGRGIFDFKIAEPVVYFFFGNGNWNDQKNWVNLQMPPEVLSGNYTIYLRPAGECIINVPQIISNGAKIIVSPDRKVTILGDLQQQ